MGFDKGNRSDGPQDEGAESKRSKSNATIDLSAWHGRSSRQVLDRLLEDDPLDLHPLALAERSDRAVLIAADRLYGRYLARIAFATALGQVWHPMDAWLREMLSRCIEELLEEDRYADQEGLSVREPEDFAFLTDQVVCNAAEARARTVCFNDLPHSIRRTYFLTAVEGRRIEELVSELDRSEAELQAELRIATRVLVDNLDPRSDAENEEGAT